MSAHDKAGEARKGLIDSVKGKAKEVAGALTGNDSLTTEGQLEQAQAQERKDANNTQAVADAEAAQAAEQAREAEVKGAQERLGVEAETAAVEQSVAQQQAASKRAVDEAERHDVARANEQAEAARKRDVAVAKVREQVEVETASEEYVEAVAEFEESAEDAAAKRAEADRLRARAQSEGGN
ncbi:MAG: CsbD family protein [Mycobacterium sp.]|jgi:uncharacterized protein YjbJ (UPF0337 family)|nr:CsbD family protein [Mycobacterium sp.]MDT5313553.1 hypothetical protein [Mycobacterium sp.]